MTKKIVLILAFVLVIAVPAFAQQVRVNWNRTPLRAEPRSTSTALAFYQAGAALDVIELSDGWYRVRDPQTKQEGYILATLVDLLPTHAPAPPSPARPGAPARPSEPRPTGAPGMPMGYAGPSETRQTAAKKPATSPHRWADRGFVAIDGVYQAGMPGFSDTFSYTENVEQATVATEYPATKGPAFGVGGAVRLWSDLALGVAVTVATRSSTGTVDATIPHPFFFNQSRAISGSVPLNRSENAVHLHALWVIPASKRLLIAVGGGPSIFSVKQSLVESVSYTQSYPYDTAIFASASVNEPSATAVGYGAMVDVGYYFTRAVGIGGMARYSKATVSLPSHDSTVSVDAGGFEAGAGLRVRFPQGKPKKATAKPPAPAKPVKK